MITIEVKIKTKEKDNSIKILDRKENHQHFIKQEPIKKVGKSKDTQPKEQSNPNHYSVDKVTSAQKKTAVYSGIKAKQIHSRLKRRLKNKKNDRVYDVSDIPETMGQREVVDTSSNNSKRNSIKQRERVTQIKGVNTYSSSGTYSSKASESYPQRRIKDRTIRKGDGYSSKSKIDIPIVRIKQKRKTDFKEQTIGSKTKQQTVESHNRTRINRIKNRDFNINSHSQTFYNERMKRQFIFKKKHESGSRFEQVGTIYSKGKVVFSHSITAIKKTVTSINTLISMGTGLLLLVVITLFLGVFSALGDDSGINSSMMPLSQEVIAYSDTIEKYAKQYDMEIYIPLIKAVMMQESGGAGTDPMQSSECGFNEKYPKVKNGITDPEYSIDVGIHYLSECFKQANIDGPTDMEHIKLGLQGYNYGSGYIKWAVEHFDGYTRANAKVFSDEQKAKLGVAVYGDPDYVEHVLRYYHVGTGGILTVAKTQIGNIGGKPYWIWYGFNVRVEWCAIFVSWCANESGELNITVPKFARVEDGIAWYKQNNKWQSRDHKPNSGDLIFFDWNNDNDPDHVGIVDRLENGYIYTVEGNSNDECRQCVYLQNSNVIYGYGIVETKEYLK